MQRSAARESCAAALERLAQCQLPDGRWIDYRLPVGASDQWVTGLVGYACADSARRLGLPQSHRAFGAAEHAGRWLATDRNYACGWGFNGVTGPDADSTAWALRLHAATDLPIRAEDVAFLRAHWIRGAGFATYRRDDGWGDAHPDVTPAVTLALPIDEREEMRSEVLAAVRGARSADGTWPSYWWRTAHYSTAANAEVLRDLRAAGEMTAPIAIHPFATCLDIACALLTACFAAQDAALRAALAAALMAFQDHDGGWPGGEDLRVTDPACRRPWEAPAGRLYRDGNGLVTTAVCVRALACHAANGQP